MTRGRVEAGAVGRYLEALDRRPNRRGPRRSDDALRARLDEISTELGSTNPLRRLHLLQERANLSAELEARAANGESLAELEEAFVAVAANYTQRHKIAWTTWRECGVPAATLRRAGLKQTN